MLKTSIWLWKVNCWRTHPNCRRSGRGTGRSRRSRGRSWSPPIFRSWAAVPESRRVPWSCRTCWAWTWNGRGSVQKRVADNPGLGAGLVAAHWSTTLARRGEHWHCEIDSEQTTLGQPPSTPLQNPTDPPLTHTEHYLRNMCLSLLEQDVIWV